MPSFIDAAIEISLAAGNLLRYHFERKIAFELKSEFDLVTEADRASEKLGGLRLAGARVGREAGGPVDLDQLAVGHVGEAHVGVGRNARLDDVSGRGKDGDGWILKYRGSHSEMEGASPVQQCQYNSGQGDNTDEW